MRLETHRISAYLVHRLKHASSLRKIHEDGGDIIELSLITGETVRIYLIENAIERYEIEGIINANTAEQVYTLFILWADMLVPGDGQYYQPDDWMAALLALYGDKLYAYDPDYLLIFPAYFEGQTGERLVRYGFVIDHFTFECDHIHTNSPWLRGYWRVAAFATGSAWTVNGPVTIPSYYAVLGIAPDASRETIKNAYRRLARRYHPDINSSPEAHAQMQAINEAYDHIMRALGDE